MMSRNYIECLKIYLGTKTNIVFDEQTIKVYIDCEIQSVLKEDDSNYILFIVERGNKRKIKEYKSEIEAKRNFAIYVRRMLNDNESTVASEFNGIKDTLELRSKMIKLTDEKWYSINNLVEDKINILKDEAGVYNILFINRNGKKYLIERDRKVPDIFEKFYREVLYYRDIMKQIVEYEKVFNDKIEYKTKIRMLGY
ncbi:hypothetical protein [Eubacterium sp.]|uniref:hypothetical protein n=1 Tax=Eubacterium sp. TaxID=142586 RepID=UPI003AEFED32